MNPAISGRYAAGITVAMVYAFRKGGMKVCADGGGEATLNRRISHPVWHERLQNKPGSGGRGGRSVVPTLRLPWSVPLRPAMTCCLRTDSNRSTMSPFELLLAYGGCTLKPVFREASLWLIECPEVAEWSLWSSCVERQLMTTKRPAAVQRDLSRSPCLCGPA